MSVSVSQSGGGGGGGGGGGKKGGHGNRLDPRELLARAEAAFKLGEEVTGDQLAAAEHLRKACEDFMGRLQRKQKQKQKKQQQQRGKHRDGGAAVAAGASSSQLPPIPELLPASPVGAAKQAADEQRRQSLDAQHKLYHAWSPVY